MKPLERAWWTDEVRYVCTRCDAGRRCLVEDECRRCGQSSAEPCDLPGCGRPATVDIDGIGWCAGHAEAIEDMPGEPTRELPEWMKKLDAEVA